jgi:hypothetical protein
LSNGEDGGRKSSSPGRAPISAVSSSLHNLPAPRISQLSQLLLFQHAPKDRYLSIDTCLSVRIDVMPRLPARLRKGQPVVELLRSLRLLPAGQTCACACA